MPSSIAATANTGSRLPVRASPSSATRTAPQAASTTPSPTRTAPQAASTTPSPTRTAPQAASTTPSPRIANSSMLTRKNNSVQAHIQRVQKARERLEDLKTARSPRIIRNKISRPEVSPFKSCLKNTTLPQPSNKSVRFNTIDGLNVHMVMPFVYNTPPMERPELEDVDLIQPKDEASFRGFTQGPGEEVYTLYLEHGLETRKPWPMPNPVVDFNAQPGIPYTCGECASHDHRDQAHWSFEIYHMRFGKHLWELSDQRLRSIEWDIKPNHWRS